MPSQHAAGIALTHAARAWRPRRARVGEQVQRRGFETSTEQSGSAFFRAAAPSGLTPVLFRLTCLSVGLRRKQQGGVRPAIHLNESQAPALHEVLHPFGEMGLPKVKPFQHPQSVQMGKTGTETWVWSGSPFGWQETPARP